MDYSCTDETLVMSVFISVSSWPVCPDTNVVAAWTEMKLKL